jgi:hypothetical protein
MRVLIICIFSCVPFLSFNQVFELDTIRFNGQMNVGEIILKKNTGYENRYLGVKNGLTKMDSTNWEWGYGILDTNTSCLHDNSRFKDLELLSNGSLAGIFYHDESCITPESVFVMLDSNGNVLVDKRFAKGISLYEGGIIEHLNLLHLYALHIAPSSLLGLTHFTYDLQGNQVDSTTRFPVYTFSSLNGFDGFEVDNDSLFIPVSLDINGTYTHTISKTNF